MTVVFIYLFTYIFNELGDWYHSQTLRPLHGLGDEVNQFLLGFIAVPSFLNIVVVNATAIPFASTTLMC